MDEFECSWGLEANPELGEDDSSVKCQSEYGGQPYFVTQANHHRLGEQRRLLYDKDRKKMLPCLNTVLDYHYQRKDKSKEGNANRGSSRSETDKMSDLVYDTGSVTSVSEDKDRDF
uniref:Uncharacterized protein n=1 Tax=Brassica oleracea var. oleracea TaxID=109376 RepID=A0A0D3A3R4_BRAOL